MSRPNWFIALEAPSGPWLARLPAPPPSVRLFAGADLHFTIAFLGGVDQHAARAAWDVLDWPSAPRDVTLGAVVPLGPPSRYSALSALLIDGREEIERTMGHARTACWAAAGVEPDPRPPKAHVTLARPQRHADDAQRAAALAWASAIDLGAPVLRLDSVALYTWSSDRARSLFRVVERASLPRISAAHPTPRSSRP